MSQKNLNASSDRSTWLIVDDVPQLQKKQDYNQFEAALKQCAYDSKRNIHSPDAFVWIPLEPVEIDIIQTKGFGLIAFKFKDEMQKFITNWKTHSSLKSFSKALNILSYQDYLQLQRLPEKYDELKNDDYFKSRNLIWYQFDDNANTDTNTNTNTHATRKNRFCDQFLLRYRGSNFQETKIYLLDELVKNKKVLVYGGEREQARKIVSVFCCFVVTCAMSSASWRDVVLLT